MKRKEIDLYFAFARETAKMSTAKRLKVGCVAVKNNRVISYGYNGTPAGRSNCCEHLTSSNEALKRRVNIDDMSPSYIDSLVETGLWVRETKQEVCHAEENLVGKLARASESSEGCVVFITHAPCFQCAKLLMVAGVSAVYYDANYRDDSGVTFLKENGIDCLSYGELCQH